MWRNCSPPPFFCVRYGNLHTLPSPTAYPIRDRRNSALLSQDSRSSPIRGNTHVIIILYIVSYVTVNILYFNVYGILVDIDFLHISVVLIKRISSCIYICVYWYVHDIWRCTQFHALSSFPPKTSNRKRSQISSFTSCSFCVLLVIFNDTLYSWSLCSSKNPVNARKRNN